MKYRDDIDPQTTWIVSDTHFGHENIKQFCHRPDDIEQTMMEKWARMVPDEDTVLHLGDLSYKSNAFFRNMIAPHLTGKRKLLIMGNHDKQRYSFYAKSGFKIVKPFKIHYGKASPYWDVSFSHYPWNEEEEGALHNNQIRIHGHIHNNGYALAAFVPYLRNHLNVSVEMMRYKPVRLKHLLDGFLYGWLPEEDGKGELDPTC